MPKSSTAEKPDKKAAKADKVQKMDEAEKTDKKDFESALNELEKIVTLLEGEVKLEEALSLFDQGMKLSQSLEQMLKSAEQKVEVLKKTVNGSAITEPYSQASEDI